MTRIRTIAAVSATAVLGVAVLAGCSSSSSTDTAASPAASAAASAESSSASMLPPVIITADQSTATCKVGDNLDIVIDEKDLAGTTVDSDQPETVSVTQAKQEGDALFNPGGKCLAAGSATITVTNPDNSVRSIAITVAE